MPDKCQLNAIQHEPSAINYLLLYNKRQSIIIIKGEKLKLT